MGVYVDKEFRVKRKSSEAGRKSAFAHKVKNGALLQIVGGDKLIIPFC